MTPKNKAQDAAQKWLTTNGIKTKDYIISCGSVGVIMSEYKDTKWFLKWVDEIVLLSDIIHKIKIPNHSVEQTPQIKAQTPLPYSCNICGRKFGKRFALTNHLKTCKKNREQSGQ